MILKKNVRWNLKYIVIGFMNQKQKNHIFYLASYYNSNVLIAKPNTTIVPIIKIAINTYGRFFSSDFIAKAKFAWHFDFLLILNFWFNSWDFNILPCSYCPLTIPLGIMLKKTNQQISFEKSDNIYHRIVTIKITLKMITVQSYKYCKN